MKIKANGGEHIKFQIKFHTMCVVFIFIFCKNYDL